MNSYHYASRRNLKTRFLNTLRKLFRANLIEQTLRQLTTGQGSNSFWAKFIPAEYLYENKSLRVHREEDLSFFLDISNYLDHSLYFGLRDDAYESLLALISPNDVIFDVGANIGSTATRFSRKAHSGKVFAFEPSWKSHARLVDHLALNDCHNVRAYKTALGRETGQLQLYRVVDTNPGMNRILDFSPQGCEAETISVKTLDGVVEAEALDRIDLIKVDVEGYEHNVLLGGERTIRKFLPRLFVEFDDENLNAQGSSALHLYEYVESLGYSVLDPSTMLPWAKISLPNCHVDLICLPVNTK